MGSYLSSTAESRRHMLAALGLSQSEELFAPIPASLQEQGAFPHAQDKPYSEWETRRLMTAAAGKNRVYPTVLRGAGAYRHIIPAAVRSITAKEGFVTAYTPYQPELSQGVLQSIFEYQSYMCRLTGLDLSNASVYDGATAAAEAVTMCRERSRRRVLVSAAERPDIVDVLRCYAFASGDTLELIPVKDGLTDLDALANLLDKDVSCVYLPQLNANGLIEDAAKAAELAHASGARFIMAFNPIAAAVLPSAKECGADIAVGDGQPLGLSLSFGGPYLGIMACKAELSRRLPGRIVGQTADAEGRRAFVLTLQAREQHIRREKASSNICSNQAHCALTAAVYLGAMGEQGLREAAGQCHAKAVYFASVLEKAGYPLAHKGAFFHEFVTLCPVNPDVLLDSLAREGILGGLPVKGGILWCVTEHNSRDELDAAARIAAECLAKEGKG